MKTLITAALIGAGCLVSTPGLAQRYVAEVLTKTYYCSAPLATDPLSDWWIFEKVTAKWHFITERFGYVPMTVEVKPPKYVDAVVETGTGTLQDCEKAKVKWKDGTTEVNRYPVN